MKQIDVKRSTVTLDPDRTHVLARPFRLMSDQRSIKISARVMALSENEVHTLLEAMRAEFGDRQLKIDEFLRRRVDAVSRLRCSIPRWCRTWISRTCRPAPCVSF